MLLCIYFYLFNLINIISSSQEAPPKSSIVFIILIAIATVLTVILLLIVIKKQYARYLMTHYNVIEIDRMRNAVIPPEPDHDADDDYENCDNF